MKRMEWLVVVLFFIAIGPVKAEDSIHISENLGSDLHLPVAYDVCKSSASYTFDFHSSKKMIGMYHDEIQGMDGYKDRLKYDKKTCTITLKGLTEQDGSKFIVTVYKNINGRSIPKTITYWIDPVTIPPYTEVKTEIPSVSEHIIQNSTHHYLRITAFYISLDSLVNALVTIGLFIKRCCNNRADDNLDLAGGISSWITIASEIVSIIITTVSGNLYALLLWLIPFILAVYTLGYCGELLERVLKALNIADNSNSIQKTALVIVMLIIQALFAAVVWLLCINNNNEISSNFEGFWPYLCLSVFIFVVLRTVVFSAVYCGKKDHFTWVVRNEPKPHLVTL